MGPEANVIKLFLSVIYEFLYQARVFVRLGWKGLPGTNTLAYYEHTLITYKKNYNIRSRTKSYTKYSYVKIITNSCHEMAAQVIVVFLKLFMNKHRDKSLTSQQSMTVEKIRIDLTSSKFKVYFTLFKILYFNT